MPKATKSADRPTPKLDEIEVTPEMIEAGMDELAEHRLLGDWPYILEAVYRAMNYAKLDASSTSEAK